MAPTHLPVFVPTAPLVLVKNIATRQVVMAASPEAQARGICQDMTLAHAHAICPNLIHGEYQPHEDRKGLIRLARWMMRFTPIVALDPSHNPENEQTLPALFLDVTGCEKLYGGLDSLMKKIHQALKAANWDVNKLVAPTDLGAPAFNLGKKKGSYWGLGDTTGDWANGLAVMIDAVQYVYVVATHYHYDKGINFYCIRLKYIGYDVFGLDNDDIDTYGAMKDNSYTKFGEMGVGITAWWQLQHQHAYAPLVTRFVVEKTFEIPAI